MLYDVHYATKRYILNSQKGGQTVYPSWVCDQRNKNIKFKQYLYDDDDD